MRYELVNITRPDTVLNNPVAGADKLDWVSPYLGIRQNIESSIALGYQSRYYTANDKLTVDPSSGNMILSREFLSLEGAQHSKAFFKEKAASFGADSLILDVYINQVDDDGIVTRID